MKKALPKMQVERFGGYAKNCISPIFKFPKISKKNSLALVAFFCISNLLAQNVTDTAYVRVIEQRCAKIVEALAIKTSKKYKKVQNILTQQYLNLNNIHNTYSSALIQIKNKKLSKEESVIALKEADSSKNKALQKQHVVFIKKLSKKLSETQIEKVKDGMTYGVVPKTWAAYQEMLPNLTQEQKGKMYAWLVEARELAMDEGTSDKKHAVFGKFKGKINNYLSAAGYDMKKEGEEWAKRIKVEKEKKENQN